MTKENQEKLDKWFLDNENCTYQEFCDIYLLGEKDLSKINFIDIPKEIRDLGFEIVFPILFEEFLTKEGIRELFIETLLQNTVSKGNTQALIMHFKENKTRIVIETYKAFFHYAIYFKRTKEGEEYWSKLEERWIKYYEKNKTRASKSSIRAVPQ